MTVASAGYFFVLLDVTIVNVALAKIGAGLGGSRSELPGGPAVWLDWRPRPSLARGRRARLEAGRKLLSRAVELYDRLEISRNTLVQGDLHHHNILEAGGRYAAIDPKPILGEPEFDVPPFLWNPLSSTMTLERTERRLGGLRGGRS